ncbi:hypothetical protein Plhal710r2_c003g0013021 [Plasmopara halstedii]
MRQKVDNRLRIQSNEMKQFHNKICLRVSARERQYRIEAQEKQRHLDEKCAKVFANTNVLQQTQNTADVRISTRPFFQKLEDQNEKLQTCRLKKHIKKILRFDARIREELLHSTVISRSLQSLNDEIETPEVLSKAPTLLPEQRVALYSTVRQQYMKMNRAQIRNGGDFETLSQVSLVASGRNNNVCRSAYHGKNVSERSEHHITINITSGCNVRVHREIATSLTPWRKTKVESFKTFSNEHDRFLRALQLHGDAPDHPR